MNNWIQLANVNGGCRGVVALDSRNPILPLVMIPPGELGVTAAGFGSSPKHAGRGAGSQLSQSGMRLYGVLAFRVGEGVELICSVPVLRWVYTPPPPVFCT